MTFLDPRRRLAGVAMTTAMSFMALAGDVLAFDRSCQDRQPAAFSRLGSRIAALGLSETSNLLAVRLLSHNAEVCSLAYEIEVLFDDGLIEVFTFDAETLVQIDIDDREQWRDFGEDRDEVEAEDEEEFDEDEEDDEEHDEEEFDGDEDDDDDEDDEEEFDEDDDDDEDEFDGDEDDDDDDDEDDEDESGDDDDDDGGDDDDN